MVISGVQKISSLKCDTKLLTVSHLESDKSDNLVQVK